MLFSSRFPNFILIAAPIIVVIAIYVVSYQEMVHLWWESGTYNHCLLVIPISLYLIYERSNSLNLGQSQIAYAGWLFLFLAAFLYLLGDYWQLSLFQHIAAIVSIPFAVWAVWGNEVARRLLFPLGFVVFAIPLGEELVPMLIDITAEGVIYLLGATGFPVYREGAMFIVPRGAFEVQEACSGSRYLLATMTIGALMAYLMLRSNLLRLVLFVVAIVLPLFANIVRAYMIVIIAHYSNNQLATGVDHIVYGWIFYALVIALLAFVAIWMGRFERVADSSASGLEAEQSGHAATPNDADTIIRLVTLSVFLIIPIVFSMMWLRPHFESLETESKTVQRINPSCSDSYFTAENMSASIVQGCTSGQEIPVYWRIVEISDYPYRELTTISSSQFKLQSSWKRRSTKILRGAMVNLEASDSVLEYRYLREDEDLIAWRFAIFPNEDVVVGYRFYIQALVDRILAPGDKIKYVTIVTPLTELDETRQRIVDQWQLISR